MVRKDASQKSRNKEDLRMWTEIKARRGGIKTTEPSKNKWVVRPDFNGAHRTVTDDEDARLKLVIPLIEVST
jgi:hypothetical protein